MNDYMASYTFSFSDKETSEMVAREFHLIRSAFGDGLRPVKESSVLMRKAVQLGLGPSMDQLDQHIAFATSGSPSFLFLYINVDPSRFCEVEEDVFRKIVLLGCIDIFFDIISKYHGKLECIDCDEYSKTVISTLVSYAQAHNVLLSDSIIDEIKCKNDEYFYAPITISPSESQQNVNEKIFFIYPQYPDNTPGFEAHENLIDALIDEYDVEIYNSFDNNLIDLINSYTLEDKPKAIITYIPHKKFSKMNGGRLKSYEKRILLLDAYQESMSLMRNIKKTIDVPIIGYIYKGFHFNLDLILMEDSGLDCVVEKTTDIKKDFENLTQALSKYLAKYKDVPEYDDKPILSEKDEFTCFTVKVNLRDGVASYSAALISQECGNYDGRVMIKKIDDTIESEICDAKSIMAILSLGIEQGVSVEFFVEGHDKSARKFSEKIYKALCARYPFTMDIEFKKD